MDKNEAASILNIDKEASPEDIKKAFKRRSKKHHPDVGGSQDAFIKLQIAQDILLGNDTPKSEATQAMGELLSAFRSVLGRTQNPLTIDLIGKTRMVLAEQKVQAAEQAKSIREDIERVTGILKRLKCKRENDIIGNMLQGHLSGAQQALGQIESKVLNLELAMTLADDYKYNPDESVNNFSTGMWGTSTFTIRTG